MNKTQTMHLRFTVQWGRQTNTGVNRQKLKLKAVSANRGKEKDNRNTREELPRFPWASEENSDPVGGLKGWKGIVQAEKTGVCIVLDIKTLRPKKKTIPLACHLWRTEPCNILFLLSWRSPWEDMRNAPRQPDSLHITQSTHLSGNKQKCHRPWSGGGVTGWSGEPWEAEAWLESSGRNSSDPLLRPTSSPTSSSPGHAPKCGTSFLPSRLWAERRAVSFYHYASVTQRILSANKIWWIK